MAPGLTLPCTVVPPPPQVPPEVAVLLWERSNGLPSFLEQLVVFLTLFVQVHSMKHARAIMPQLPCPSGCGWAFPRPPSHGHPDPRLPAPLCRASCRRRRRCPPKTTALARRGGGGQWRRCR